MSRKHSFVLTLSNNVTEKEGVNYLIENYSGFFKIDLITKKELLNLLNIEHRFLQAFDLIYIPEMVGKITDEDFIQTYLEDIILIELKTTKKYLPENPKGFFFGATENEFNFGKILGSTGTYSRPAGCDHQATAKHDPPMGAPARPARHSFAGQ